MDYLYHNTTENGLYHILQERKLKTPQKLGLAASSAEHKNLVFCSPIQAELIPDLEKANDRFGVVLNPSILEKYPTYFINTGNSFGPRPGTKSYGTCNCAKTFYSDAMRKLIEPTSKDCYIETQDEMIQVLKDEYSEGLSLFDTCDGGPELGILPDAGEVDIKDYIHKVIYPPRESLKRTTAEGIQKTIGLDDFYKVIAAAGGEGGRRRLQRRRKTLRRRQTRKRIMRK